MQKMTAQRNLETGHNERGVFLRENIMQKWPVGTTTDRPSTIGKNNPSSDTGHVGVGYMSPKCPYPSGDPGFHLIMVLLAP